MCSQGWTFATPCEAITSLGSLQWTHRRRCGQGKMHTEHRKLPDSARKKYFLHSFLHSSSALKRQCFRYCGLKLNVLLKLMSHFIPRPIHRPKSRVRRAQLPSVRQRGLHHPVLQSSCSGWAGSCGSKSASASTRRTHQSRIHLCGTLRAECMTARRPAPGGGGGGAGRARA